MGELGGEPRGLVGLIVDVVLWSIELDSCENSDGFELAKKSAYLKGASKEVRYPRGCSGSI